MVRLGQGQVTIALPGLHVVQASQVGQLAKLQVKSLCLEVLRKHPHIKVMLHLQPRVLRGHISGNWQLRGHFRGRMKKGRRVRVDGLFRDPRL